MAITVTERAAREVKRVKEEQKFEDEMFLRIGVAGGGCSGFNYSLGFDKRLRSKKDAKYDYHGIEVVVDKKSALYLDGTRWTGTRASSDAGLRSTIPNAVKTCGCGSSFQA